MARWKNALRTKDEISELKRAVVLRESGRLFCRLGYHDTSLVDIAKELGVSKGTLYNYVKDKQEILFEFHRMALSVGMRALQDADASEGNGASKLAAAMRQFILALINELGGYGILSEVGALKPHDRDEIIALRTAFYARFEALVQRGIEDGSIRPTDAHMPVVAFMGVLQNLPNWYSPAGRLSAEEVADAITDVLVRGIRVRPAGGAAKADRKQGAS